MGDIRCAF